MESKFTSFKLNEGENEKLTENNDDLLEQNLDVDVGQWNTTWYLPALTRKVLRNFLAEQLEIESNIEFTSVQRFGKQKKKNSRPIVAKFIYEQDLLCVLKCAKNWKDNHIKLIGNSRKR